MSYPDVSAVILDASFDDLVPLALKVMPDSWSECISQACPSWEGVVWNWELFQLRWPPFPWVGCKSPHCWKQEDSFLWGPQFSFSVNSEDLYVGQRLCLCHPFTFIPL